MSAAPLTPRSHIISLILQKTNPDPPFTIRFDSGAARSVVNDIGKKSDIKDIFDKAVEYIKQVHQNTKSRIKLTVSITVEQRGEQVAEFMYTPPIPIPDGTHCHSEGEESSSSSD